MSEVRIGCTITARERERLGRIVKRERTTIGGVVKAAIRLALRKPDELIFPPDRRQAHLSRKFV